MHLKVFRPALAPLAKGNVFSAGSSFPFVTRSDRVRPADPLMPLQSTDCFKYGNIKRVKCKHMYLICIDSDVERPRTWSQSRNLSLQSSSSSSDRIPTPTRGLFGDRVLR